MEKMDEFVIKVSEVIHAQEKSCGRFSFCAIHTKNILLQEKEFVALLLGKGFSVDKTAEIMADLVNREYQKIDPLHLTPSS